VPDGPVPPNANEWRVGARGGERCDLRLLCVLLCVRRGIDVFKALALGARTVAVGRPVLRASAVGGAPGVGSVYTHLAGEMKSAMLLSGVAKVGDIGREHVVLAKA
jgi:hypothetical protein